MAFGKMAKGNFLRPAQPLNANINLRYAGIHTNVMKEGQIIGKKKEKSEKSELIDNREP